MSLPLNGGKSRGDTHFLEGAKLQNSTSEKEKNLMCQKLGFESHCRWQAMHKIIFMFVPDIKIEHSRVLSAVP
jgi:hypothetical protein